MPSAAISRTNNVAGAVIALIIRWLGEQDVIRRVSRDLFFPLATEEDLLPARVGFGILLHFCVYVQLGLPGAIAVVFQPASSWKGPLSWDTIASTASFVAPS